MAQEEKGSVNTQTLAVAVVVALVVGFFGGVIYSSMQGGGQGGGVSSAPQTAPPQPLSPPGGQQAPVGPNPQQASTILSLEQRVASNPDDAEAWVQLGNTYFDTNNFNKAITAYNRYLTLHPNNANVLTDLGIMFRNSGQPQEAITTFDRALGVDPTHVQAAFNKGVVLMNDLHDHKGAIAVWQKLVDVNPGVTATNGMPVSQVIEDAKQQMAAEGK